MKESKLARYALQLVDVALPRTALHERVPGRGQQCALADIKYSTYGGILNGVFTTKLTNPPRLAQCRPDSHKQRAN